MSKKLEIIFSEFYSQWEPNLLNVGGYFPEANISVYTELNATLRFDRSHTRWGWRMHDYNQLEKMLASDADTVIVLDADMHIVSQDVRTILPLVDKFGLCLPSNNRHLVRVDTLIGADTDLGLDETNGTGYAFNSAIIALNKKDQAARAVIEEAARIMRHNPIRLPLALWRAVYACAFYPCLLPPQWCVCAGDEGCGNEIILHIGHEKVREFYGFAKK